jgi:hypothetical protein
MIFMALVVGVLMGAAGMWFLIKQGQVTPPK